MRAILIFSLIAASGAANAGASCNPSLINSTMEKTNAQKLADARCIVDAANCGYSPSEEPADATTERQQPAPQNSTKPSGS